MAARGYPDGSASADQTMGKRELICFTTVGSDVQIDATGARSALTPDLGVLGDIAAAPDITFTPVFGTAERLRAAIAEGAAEAVPADTEALLADMARCYHVDAPDDRLEDLAEQLATAGTVESAYVKPAPALATVTSSRRAKTAVRTASKAKAKAAARPEVTVDLDGSINQMQPTGEDAPPITPDLVLRQGYLEIAPAGIDARYAWTQPGGRGTGVRVIDCEWGWRFTHEDLRLNQGGVVVGTASADTNHGTAVLGEISGDVNTFGITGIAPDTTVFGAAFSLPTAQVIQQAADRLGAGDILLLEIHRQGPGASGIGQDGYIAVEWWPDDYLAIRYASNRGVIVVEAAGNGARNLDDAIYDTRPAGLPAVVAQPVPAQPAGLRCGDLRRRRTTAGDARP